VDERVFINLNKKRGALLDSVQIARVDDYKSSFAVGWECYFEKGKHNRWVINTSAHQLKCMNNNIACKDDLAWRRCNCLCEAC
jgi:hypothetical protein